MYTAVSRDSMPWLTAVYMVGHKKCHFRFYDNFGTCRLLLLSLFLSLYVPIMRPASQSGPMHNPRVRSFTFRNEFEMK